MAEKTITLHLETKYGLKIADSQANPVKITLTKTQYDEFSKGGIDAVRDFVLSRYVKNGNKPDSLEDSDIMSVDLYKEHIYSADQVCFDGVDFMDVCGRREFPGPELYSKGDLSKIFRLSRDCHHGFLSEGD